MRTNRLHLSALMLIALAGLRGLEQSSPLAVAAGKENAEPLTLVVMDPLALPLSCPCVKGYAQRDYDKLAAHLGKKIGRPMKVYFSESLTGALTKKTAGKADIIIGKDSVVRAGAKENKIDVACVAALTGKDGKTTQTGLWVVASKDPALTVSDLKGYELIFGTADCDEKHVAALTLLKDLGVTPPSKLKSCNSCSDGATKVIDGYKSGKKIATVISSYAQPLLEGCGTIKKGDLRVVGETDPLPFVAAFVNSKLTAEERTAIEKALLSVSNDAGLCKSLETKNGFVAPATLAAKKK
jgi:ABC-type phosphate/phosphonate transport system substrate-binding protein